MIIEANQIDFSNQESQTFIISKTINIKITIKITSIKEISVSTKREAQQAGNQYLYGVSLELSFNKTISYLMYDSF